MPALIRAWKKQLQQGNTQPLAIVFTKFGPACLRVLQKKGCSREDAEDILQDAVLIFRQNILEGKLQQSKKLNKYLYTICLNLYRIRQRQPIQADISEALLSNSTNQRESAIPEETIVRMMEAFHQLSPKCQQLLTAYYDYGWHMDEIAEKLQLASADVAKATKFRCVRCWTKQIEALTDRREVSTRKEQPQ